MIVTKRYKKIPENLKSKILEASLVPGCRIADLAVAHGIAAWTIYTWRKEAAVKSSHNNPTTKFVELSVNREECANLDRTSSGQAHLSSVGSNSYSSLQKASLTFKHFSLCIEGMIKQSTLLKVIKTMDEEESSL